MKAINTARITRLAFFVALALIFSLLENMLPPLVSYLQGAKMGLSNVVTLVALIALGSIDAAIVQFSRCILTAIMSGRVSALMFSMPAGLTSLLIMIILYNLAFPRISLMTISFAGAVAHNLTQLAVASVILKTNMVIFLPLYIIASTLAGLFVGILAYFIIKKLPKRLYLIEQNKKNNISN